MGNLPADISNMENDFPYDFTMPTAIEIAQLIQFNLVRAIMIAFPEFAWDDWLDLHGNQANVPRNNATSATGAISVTAEYGTVLEKGTIFAVPATDQNDAIEFETMETVTFEESGTLDIQISAVIPGTSGNVPADTITIMSKPITGVTAIRNAEKTSGGTGREEDDEYYERIHAEFRDAQFYVGNDADYIKWAKEVAGIGDCIVIPEAEGPGTVKLILVDSNGQPATENLVAAVYDHIVSPNDRSKRLLPTGSAKLIVESAELKTIDFICTGLILKGISLDSVIADFKEAMTLVYSVAKADNILRYNTARTVLSNISGVEDFSDFLMNGERVNIVLESAVYAETGTVDFALEGE